MMVIATMNSVPHY